MHDPVRYSFAPCSWHDVHALQRALGCSETLAWVLVRRGGTDVAQARALLADQGPPEPTAFHDPLLLGDMAAAVERLRFAIDHHEPIVVHGDYDCDGVCSTTLLVEALESLGADVRAFLPDRFANGYGLQLDSVDRFAAEGAKVVLAVDCGITAVEPVAQATDRGMDVVICDHHRPGPVLPGAILCSTRPSDYPFPDLCAAGAAGKLVQALGAPYGDAQHELEAVATIADVVPLIGENRAIARRGLAALRRTQRPGLRALLAVTDLRASAVDEQDVAFRLAPRINAVGRMAHPDRAYELLRAETEEVATRCAADLHEHNAERRRVEQTMLDQALEQVAGWADELREARVYVVDGADWHEGVVGIVAARLVQRFHRPVLAIASAGALARGSGRSIPGVDLHAALTACSDELITFGGHTAAVGLSLDPADLDAFRARVVAWSRDALTADDLVPVEAIDAVVAGDELGLPLADELQRLAPFGCGNPQPRLLAVGAGVDDLQQVGGDKHLRGVLKVNGVAASMIGFGQGRHLQAASRATQLDAVVRMSINRFRGVESMQLEVERLVAPPGLPPHATGLCTTTCGYDCQARVPLRSVLEAVAGPASFDAADLAQSVATDVLRSRPGTLDLRGRNRGVAHVARLATAGATQLVVCSDVSRRRELLRTALHPARLGINGIVLASGRCDPVGVARRLDRLAGVEAGGRVVLADHDRLDEVLAGPVTFDAVVVLDPPVTDAQRDCLASISAPLHLVWGAAETRFAGAVARAVLDARATLRSSWGALKHGPLSEGRLEHALFGHADDPHLHTPAAVAHALRELEQRDLARIDAESLTVTPLEPSVPTPPRLAAPEPPKTSLL